MDGRSLWGWGPGTPRGHSRQTCCWFGTLSRAVEVSCRRARAQLITCVVYLRHCRNSQVRRLTAPLGRLLESSVNTQAPSQRGVLWRGTVSKGAQEASPEAAQCGDFRSTSSYWASPRVTVGSARCRKPAVRGACPPTWQRTQGPGLLGSRESEWKGLPRGRVARVTLSAHCELAGGPSAGQPWWAEAERPLQSLGWGRAGSPSARTGGFMLSGPGSSVCWFPSSAPSSARGQLHVRAPGVWVLGEPGAAGCDAGWHS